MIIDGMSKLVVNLQDKIWNGEFGLEVSSPTAFVSEFITDEFCWHLFFVH